MTTDPTADAELLRLLDEHCRDWCVAGDGGDVAPMEASLAALLDYVAEHYARRTPYAGADNAAARLAVERYRAAREADAAAGDPPVVTPAVPSREVMVRIVGRKRVVSAKYPEELVDGR